ncbi:MULTISPECIES: phosphoribosyltransferase [Hymenobacter]|uniref:Hypoxanthine phosphoribosyltransferase n=1 Tax=Hymenobacter armeniacus TaxID=2771358 RepID=A0ABR8JR63_9BACT|nr:MULTISPECIES: phosphoribosyltransferase family protein [Hymenobacter]MBD2721812.1 hypoxanthine phosphoribosyltransferase [Hymenobacter armeniacus]MBJ6108271.1 hypoxanthine phosphoribosyltransferase [Hymenobacter sp. BT523]
MGHSQITIHNKAFRPYLSAAQLDEAVTELAARLSAEYAGRQPLFVVVLTGGFMFASDLLKKYTGECEIVFIRVASYEGTESSGLVQEILGLREEVQGRDLIIVEDIVDTGTTMHHLLPTLLAKGPASVEIAALFFKPASLRHELTVRYVAREIPNDFVVGYGLDYDGLGRNLPDVYVAV